MADLGKVTGTITSLEMVGGTVGHCLGCVVRCHGLFCEHLDCLLGVLGGYVGVSAGV